MDLQPIIEFIDKSKWIEAKTYAKTAPHEYCLMKNTPYKDRCFFYKIANLIQTEWYIKKFWRMDFKYYDIWDYMYWTCDFPIEKTDLINRALKNKQTDYVKNNIIQEALDSINI